MGSKESKLIEWSESEMLLNYNGEFLEHESQFVSTIFHEFFISGKLISKKNLNYFSDSYNNEDGRLNCRKKLKITFNFKVSRLIGNISPVIRTIIFYS